MADGWLLIFTDQLSEDVCAVEKDIEVTRARDFNPRHTRLTAQTFSQVRGNFARVALLASRSLDAFGQLKGDGKREVAERGARRHFGGHIVKLEIETLA